MRSRFWFWIALPLSILSVGEFFLPWYVSLAHLITIMLVVILAGVGMGEFLTRSLKILWITLPVFFLTLRTKQTGLFLGWFYLDPVVDYGILMLRLVNFSGSFWILQKLWYLPLQGLTNVMLFRIFWKAFGLTLDMWNDVLLWPKQRFSLRHWIERRYEKGAIELNSGSVLSEEKKETLR